MTDNLHPASNSRQPASFEQGLAELADIVTRLESGTLGLSESITAYETGVSLLRNLHEELANVEERVSKLVRIDSEGGPVLAPFSTEDPSAASATPARKASTRDSGRTRKRSSPLPGMDDADDDA